jgi:2-iminobutanoate/2-iminopropanoate deaminase
MSERIERKVISTPAAPQAIGPYSQAIVAGPFLYTSGQVALDPDTGELVGAGDVKAQAERVMANLKAVLTAAGTSFDRVVKSTIFLQDLADFGHVNAIYGACFQFPPPARSTVQVAGLPKGALVEIELVALVP